MTAKRNEALPKAVPAGGLVILRDGDPGEPDVTLTRALARQRSEQAQILEFIDTQQKTISAAAVRAPSEIELIREYRERLIAHLVTGKLDVRGVSLPDVGEGEAAEEEALPDLDAIEDEADEALPQEAEA